MCHAMNFRSFWKKDTGGTSPSTAASVPTPVAPRGVDKAAKSFASLNRAKSSAAENSLEGNRGVLFLTMPDDGGMEQTVVFKAPGDGRAAMECMAMTLAEQCGLPGPKTRLLSANGGELAALRGRLTELDRGGNPGGKDSLRYLDQEKNTPFAFVMDLVPGAKTLGTAGREGSEWFLMFEGPNKEREPEPPDLVRREREITAPAREILTAPGVMTGLGKMALFHFFVGNLDTFPNFTQNTETIRTSANRQGKGNPGNLMFGAQTEGDSTTVTPQCFDLEVGLRKARTAPDANVFAGAWPAEIKGNSQTKEKVLALFTTTDGSGRVSTKPRFKGTAAESKERFVLLEDADLKQALAEEGINVSDKAVAQLRQQLLDYTPSEAQFAAFIDQLIENPEIYAAKLAAMCAHSFGLPLDAALIKQFQIGMLEMIAETAAKVDLSGSLDALAEQTGSTEDLHGYLTTPMQHPGGRGSTKRFEQEVFDANVRVLQAAAQRAARKLEELKSA